jgi:hypothetical protein
MPKNAVQKIFDRWLAHSGIRFHYPPRVVLRRKASFVLQFVGITPALQCHISKWGAVEMRVMYQQMAWDMLTEFDVFERRTSTGQYYCDCCTSPEMFDAREALWVTHSFEPLLAWTNEHFHPSQWLCLFGAPGRYSFAELRPIEHGQVRETAENFVSACPVVVRGKKSTAQSS